MPLDVTTGRAFDGVLLDWRGTLVVAPTWTWLVTSALDRLGRPSTQLDVEAVLASLRATDRSAIGSPLLDTDADLHRATYLDVFARAAIDPELAAELYAVESDVHANPFARDVEELLVRLDAAGVRVAVLSDIHVDPRPAFARHELPDGRTWADLVTAWVLSYETGVAKPDPAAFTLALDRLGLPADRVLMVGDRGAWDGGAAAVGVVTLLVPPLTHEQEARLARVLDLVLPGWRTPRRCD